MAQVFGTPGEEWGDEEVYKTLQKLPDQYLIYSQPVISYDGKERFPDYVLIDPGQGVIVLEVKDWVNILEVRADEVKIQRVQGKQEAWETHPLKQAQDTCYLLMDTLQRDPELIHRNGFLQGKLTFPIEYAAFLPHQPASTISQIVQARGDGRIFGKSELDPEILKRRLAEFPYTFGMSQDLSGRQLELIRPILDPRLVLRAEDGTQKGVLDIGQEKLAKEPLGEVSESPDGEARQSDFLDADTSMADLEELEDQLPDEAADLKEASHIRLVRGYAGTGKTDVILLRAHYLYEQYPEKKILLTTFNKPVCEKRLRPAVKGLEDRVDVRTFDSLCNAIYKKKNQGLWRDPQKTRGLVAKLLDDGTPISDLIKKYGKDFISDEIIWMKEAGYNSRDAYLNNYREGRGKISGRNLSVNQKKEVFRIYEAYQEGLSEIPAFDWVDLHDKALEYLREGISPDELYDVILIDEGQHFAPAWISVIKHHLAPSGAIYICEDPSQSVYRVFSWRERGVEVVGRTRWLRIPYRNTRQIFEAAYHLARSNPVAMQMVKESGGDIEPDFDSEYLRDGEKPIIRKFPDVNTELNYVVQEIDRLIKEGYSPKDIAVFHDKKYVRSKYQGRLPAGVTIDKPRRQTGMEYRAVFIPRVQELFERDTSLPWKQDQAKQQYLFYTAMTRARDKLYMLHQQKWPKQLDDVKVYCRSENHTHSLRGKL